MKSIYGWITSSEKRYNTNPITKQFQLSKCLSSLSQLNACSRDYFEIGGHSDHKPPVIFESDRLLAIVDGSPTWQDSSLARIAEHQEAAHALAEGFIQHGKSVLSKMRGPFALCLLEPKANYALLAIDRLGIRPLAYTFQNDLLVFGSQLDQIIAHPGISREIDQTGYI